MSGRPRLLMYCQHSVGIGHLMRLLRLIDAMSERFAITLLSGGHWPRQLPLPAQVQVVQLPALQMQDHALVADPAAGPLPLLQRARRRLVLETYRRTAPDLVLVELFPFGRKKFSFELLPLLVTARRDPRRPRIVCSLRDILVDARPNQQRHDDRAARIANRYCDAVLVHADPAFARLQDSFRPSLPLAVPVHYTGFVAPPGRGPGRAAPRVDALLVSVGGGRVGESLLRLALDAHACLPREQRPRLRLIVGPLGHSSVATALRARGEECDDVEVIDVVDDLRAEMSRARYSLSQGGYNTVMDVLGSGVKALLVPYAEGGENEQEKRARRLAALGLVRQVDHAGLTPASLAAAFIALRDFEPGRCKFDFGGAANSACTLLSLLGRRAGERVA